MKVYASDFEATTSKSYEKEGLVRVWAWQSRDVQDHQVAAQGTCIDSYMEWLLNHKKTATVYFHNLKYDGQFIIDYLLNNNWKSLKTNEKPENNSFKTIISSDGIFFELTIYLRVYKTRQVKIVIRDSAKKIPLSIEEMAEAFDTGLTKKEIDYDLYRAPGYEPNELEWEYLGIDTLILSKALNEVLEQGMNKLTIAGDAMYDFKQRVGKEWWYKLFPTVNNNVDRFIRSSYRGGYVYLKPEHAERVFEETTSYDVNSLYPWVMYTQELPFGLPQYYEGHYEEDYKYPLYIQSILVDFDLKEGYLPTIQAKNNPIYQPTEYITDSKGELLELHLTNVDLELFLEHHNVYHIEYIEGYKFESTTNLFTNYIEHWYGIKESSFGGKRFLAKLMLNSLYGKFGTKIERNSKLPTLEDDEIDYELYSGNSTRPVYTAVSSFITSYARRETIVSAQLNYDNFIYADTDSIHLIGTDIPNAITIDDNMLGAWAHEGNFNKSKFLRPKTYIKESVNGLEIVCSGLPDKARKDITFDSFKLGATFKGKLSNTVVKGGAMLREVDFTIHKD